MLNCSVTAEPFGSDEFSELLKTSLEDLTWGGIDETLKTDLVSPICILPKKTMLKRLKVRLKGCVCVCVFFLFSFFIT